MGTTTFVLNGNRIYAKLDFIRPDGSIHPALAFVDMGSPSMTIRESLFKELEIGEDQTLRFRVGEQFVQLPLASVTVESRPPTSIGSDFKVEAMLPAGILKKYQVVIDYQKQTLTLAQPRRVEVEGTPVPFHINQETGLIAVDALVDGQPYRITIDNGSAYTWVRQTIAKDWLESHPDWERGVGAVGASNMMMAGDNTETSGILLRIPEIALGSLKLKNVGVLAAGPSNVFPENLDLFDWYSQKNAVTVIGWLGGNVLKRFRLLIDYPNRMTYWSKQSDFDIHDLDQIGLTLRFERGTYFVAKVATKNGKPTVEGVLQGDKLIRVGELETELATWGAIYDAMHGEPGETRSLIIERKGKQLRVVAKVTAF